MIPEAAVEAAAKQLRLKFVRSPRQEHFEVAARAALEAAAPHMAPAARTITTAEELDALPVGTVVLSDAYRYMVWGGTDCGWPVSFQRWRGGDWHRGGRSSSTHPDNIVPATILHEPQEEEAHGND